MSFFNNRAKTLLLQKILGRRCKICYHEFSKNVLISTVSQWITNKLFTRYNGKQLKSNKPIKKDTKYLTKETYGGMPLKSETSLLCKTKTVGNVIELEVQCSSCFYSQVIEIDKEFLGKNLK